MPCLREPGRINAAKEARKLVAGFRTVNPYGTMSYRANSELEPIA
jgi:hypothetical protein